MGSDHCILIARVLLTIRYKDILLGYHCSRYEEEILYNTNTKLLASIQGILKTM